MDVNPKLRPLEVAWIKHNGRPGILIRDRLGISQSAAVVPEALVPILPLCDGTRGVQALRAGFELRTGIPISLPVVQQLVEQLDEALFLDSPRFSEAYQAALEEYRAAPFRPMALAGQMYPQAPEALEQALKGYGSELGVTPEVTGSLRGVICPHIDYARGGPTYAAVWNQAAQAAHDADLVLVFGTDHAGGPSLNLTIQSYATPWGVLPTDRNIVEELAGLLGGGPAFSHELHHRNEHSVEAALVWLHYVREGQPCPVVPVLCGGMGQEDGAGDGSDRLLEVTEALRRATAGRRVLAVAAADLAHVGPAFGDPHPFGPLEQARLSAEDEELLSAVSAGDPQAFLDRVLADGDRRRVCGAPPIYALLRFLDGSRGEVTGYAQCPADPEGASFVSIAGVILR